jgi:microcin C transport system permease protein
MAGELMLSYILKRLLLLLPTLFGVLLVTFAITQFVPGGPVEQMVQQLRGDALAAGGGETARGGDVYRANKGIDAKKIAEIKELYGFDKPVHERFWLMVKGFATFDLGKSLFYNKSVWELIKEKLPVSISLGLWTFFLTYAVSVPLGIAKAVRHGSRFDILTTMALLLGYAIPGFVLGVLLLVLFGGGSFWQLFPLRGLTSDNFAQLSVMGKVMDYLWHICLPLVCMVLGSFAVTTLLQKSTFLEEIRKQYVTVARAKGLSERAIMFKHVFRNALLPIMTGFPAAFVGAFFTGSLLIETLFSLDGLGLLSFDAVIKRDYPVVMGSLFLFTLIGLLTKLITDLSYVLIDPRVKFESLS